MIDTANRTHYFEFGGFRLDATNRILLKGGEHISLTQKSFEILLLLVSNRNRMLKKQEILDEVWSESFVEEANLAQHVYMVRKALKANGCDKDIIETIPKYGYRFNGEVQEGFADSLPSAPVRNSSAVVSAAEHLLHFRVPDTTSTAKSRNRIYLLAGTALAALVLAAGLFALSVYLFDSRPAGNRLADIKAISVLPFEQIGGQADDKLRLGLADTLISRLGNDNTIAVSPTSTVSRFADSGKSPVEIGRELGVDAVLTGTIQRSGPRVRVNVQLVSVDLRAPVWADRIDTDVSDIFRLQDVVSREVASKLSATLDGRPETPDSESQEPVKPESVQAFTKGIYFWNKRTPNNLIRAIDHFSEAVRIDPTFAEAQAMLADTYALAAIYGAKPLKPEEAIGKAKLHADKALAIDGSNSEAYSALAVVAQYEKDAQRALVLLKKAVQVDGANATARMRLAWMYAAEEDLSAAISEMKAAQAADPHSQLINLNLARLLRLNRQTDEALKFGKRAVELDPSTSWTRLILAEIYEQKGMLDESIKELRAVPDSSPEQKTARLLMGRVLAKKGRKKEARKILADVATAKTDEAPAYEIATVYALLGEKREAVNELMKSGEASLLHYLHVKYDYNLDSLRDNPQYPAIVNSSKKAFTDKYDKSS